MPNHVLKRLILNLLVIPYDIYIYCKDLFKKTHLRYKVILDQQVGLLPAPPAVRRAVVVGAFPNIYSVPFLIHLLDGFVENDFFVLLVVEQKLADDLKKRVLAHCHYLIERAPAGQDFGSYKLGWEWLEKNGKLPSLDLLAFVNDSLYYPKRIASTLKDLLQLPADWLCLFENFQTLYHTQSFFQVFRSPVIQSLSFKKFWRDYRPSSIRMDVIKKGEVGLTSALYTAGFEPAALYNSFSLRRDVADILKNETHSADFEDVLQLTIGFERRNDRPQVFSQRQDFRILVPSEVAHKVSVMAERYNPTHALGLLCNHLYEAPLKRDICYRNITTMSALAGLAKGFSKEEKEAMAHDLHRKGVPAQFAGIRKLPLWLLWTTGRI